MKTSEMNIVLTGATGGIGQAIAKQLIGKVQSLVLVGRHQSTLANLHKELTSTQTEPKTQVAIIATDIGFESGRSALFQELDRLQLDADVLINNAGISDFCLIEEQTSQSIDRIMSINAMSPIHLCQAFVLHIKRMGIESARIINVGSTFGSLGFPGFSSYCASKFAIRGFSEALARELAHSNISVQYFSPRATHTGLNNSAAEAMNECLKVNVDTPEWVAEQLWQTLKSDYRRKQLGWPERLSLLFNDLFPNFVDRAIKKDLSTIRQFAARKWIDDGEVGNPSP